MTIKSDLLDEDNETYDVNLSNASNATIADATGVGTINDDDAAPTIAINDVTTDPEGDAGTQTASFTVSLSAASGKTVTVNYATANDTATSGSDYVATTGTVTFTPGDTSETISVTINGDTADEANETYNVNEGDGTATITVTRTGGSDGAVSVDYDTSNGSATAPGDYAATSGTLNWADGDTASKTFTVTIEDDNVFNEGTETVNLTLSNSTGGATLGSPNTAILNISENDIDTTGPRITEVCVTGTGWTDRFHGAGALNNPAGYVLPTGADQLKTMPWRYVDCIRIVFNEPVIVQQSDLTIRGVNTPVFAIATNGFSYDAATRTATWQLTGNIGLDKVRLQLADSVTDAHGNALDGEWTDGTSTQSGNGASGGAFDYRFNMLPADADQDGTVTAADQTLVRNAIGKDFGEGYDVMYDIDSSGRISTGDFGATRIFTGTTLPSGEPASN